MRSCRRSHGQIYTLLRVNIILMKMTYLQHCPENGVDLTNKYATFNYPKYLMPPTVDEDAVEDQTLVGDDGASVISHQLNEDEAESSIEIVPGPPPPAAVVPINVDEESAITLEETQPAGTHHSSENGSIPSTSTSTIHDNSDTLEYTTAREQGSSHREKKRASVQQVDENRMMTEADDLLMSHVDCVNDDTALSSVTHAFPDTAAPREEAVSTRTTNQPRNTVTARVDDIFRPLENLFGQQEVSGRALQDDENLQDIPTAVRPVPEGAPNIIAPAQAREGAILRQTEGDDVGSSGTTSSSRPPPDPDATMTPGVDDDVPLAQRAHPRRNRGINRRYHHRDFEQYNVRSLQYGDGVIARLDWSIPPKSSQGKALALLAEIQRDYTLNHHEPPPHPAALAVKLHDADSPTYEMAMTSEDNLGYQDAMDTEINALAKKNAWTVTSISCATATGKRILGSTWAFRRKRYPDGRVKKLKARICVRGDQQIIGVDVFDTYAPVVQWSTVRLVLTLTVALGLETIQVDYANAFVQAELDYDVFMRCPRGYEVPGCVLKLNRSVYGLRERPLNWFHKLTSNLEKAGFSANPNQEPCLFMKKGLVVIIYVDDCIFCGASKTDLWKEIKTLRQQGLELDEEEDMAGFLGVQISTLSNGSKELTQTGLIDRILSVMDLESVNGKATPAEHGAIGALKHDSPYAGQWNYRSIVGMMMYLATNSRPDIAFAVNQCVRYSNNPKEGHAKALKRIAAYLKQTRDRGMIMQPTKDLTLDLWVDADFAGLWNYEDADDPACVRSRTGYVLTLGDVPVTWKSKLMSEIALSTCESEYIAASQGMRDLLPMRKVLASLCTCLAIARPSHAKVSCVWEDNQAALSLMQQTLPKLTPRTKHIGIKYHWFRSHFKDKQIIPKKIGTTQQRADIFTKGATHTGV